MDREQRYPVSVGSNDPLFNETEYRRVHELRNSGQSLEDAKWQARSERVRALQQQVKKLKEAWKDDLMMRGFADWEAQEVLDAAVLGGAPDG